jgi:hypothetical protein
MYGALILVVSMACLGYAIRSKDKTKEGHEKPLMDVEMSDRDENHDE